MCYVSKKAKQVILIILITIFLAAILLWFYVSQSSHALVFNLGKNFITIKPNSRSLTIELTEKIFQMRLGSQVSEMLYAADCYIHMGTMSACMEWIDDTNTFSVTAARTIVQFQDGGDDGVNCLNVNWQIYAADFPLEDCVSMDIGHWYGGAEINQLKWPLEKNSISMQPYVTSNVVENIDAYGSVLERYWLSSSGVAVVFDKTTPLHVGVNATTKELCFRSSYVNSPYKNPSNALPHLNYSICMSRNMRRVHDFIAKNNFKKPLSVPSVQMFEFPIWSTLARYNQNVTQENVLDYAKEIKKHKFPISQIEIDDFYNTQYGEIDFDSNKFPNPQGMVQELHGHGFQVTLWSHPFANFESNCFKEGLLNGFWIHDSKDIVPGLVKWWNGVAATIDPTNSEAAHWFVRRHENLQKTTGIDSFKFDAGETQYLPLYFTSNKTFNDPNLYCSHYINMITENTMNVRCGHQSQKYPVFVRMMDKNSNWGYENGLKTLIPSAILFGLLGYPFVLPSVIGGNSHINGNANGVNLPERELFIRWLQVTAYLPSMPFSIAPWQYDEEVVTISRKMVDIHKNKVAPILLQLAKETIETGHPIIRPLWWIAPDDPICQELDSEFLIGDSFLVAPILDYGARKRNIYLPSGSWQDSSTSAIYSGERWITDFLVPINHVATFEKVKDG